MPPRARRRVTVYHADGCHLCDRAIEVVRDARTRTPFDLELVDIGGSADLEAAYREFLPVVEIDGVRVFTYFLTEAALLDRLEDDGCRGGRGGPAGNM